MKIQGMSSVSNINKISDMVYEIHSTVLGINADENGSCPATLCVMETFIGKVNQAFLWTDLSASWNFWSKYMYNDMESPREPNALYTNVSEIRDCRTNVREV